MPNDRLGEEESYYNQLGKLFTAFIRNYNDKLVFGKNVKTERPLDQLKLGGSSQRNTLYKLRDGGACTMTALADNINYDRGNMTKLIDDLVKKNIVRRYRNDDDRRNVYVELTDEGRALITRESETFLVNAEAMMAHFTEEERQEFLNALSVCTEYMTKL